MIGHKNRYVAGVFVVVVCLIVWEEGIIFKRKGKANHSLETWEWWGQSCTLGHFETFV